jgi:hypothetical protein
MAAPAAVLVLVTVLLVKTKSKWSWPCQKTRYCKMEGGWLGGLERLRERERERERERKMQAKMIVSVYRRCSSYCLAGQRATRGDRAG